MKRSGRLQLSLVVAGTLVLSAGAAKAFTFTDQNGNSGTGTGQGYLDLDSKSSNRNDVPANRFGTDNQGTFRSGNTTLQWGGATGGSFNQRYNSENMFNPYTRDGR